uniref:Uncharacterized protein n=1 Tax=Nitrosopumivirus cobalaminus TaxID=3158414 RepID=A0AAU7N437_9VIRU
MKLGIGVIVFLLSMQVLAIYLAVTGIDLYKAPL